MAAAASARRSALVVAIPEAEPVVGDWRRRHADGSLGIPAHVTVLFPFAPAAGLDDALLAELGELFAAEPAFSVVFPRVDRFTDVVWLAPQPAEPFRRLTEIVFARYPQYAPYEGAHDAVVPHLTVAAGGRELQDRVERALSPALPIAAEVDEVTLLEELPHGHWQPRETFPLRTASGGGFG